MIARVRQACARQARLRQAGARQARVGQARVGQARAATPWLASLVALPFALAACGGSVPAAPPAAPAGATALSPCAESHPALDETTAFGKPLAAICIQGAPPGPITERLGLRVGDMLTEAALQRAIRELNEVADDATASARQVGDGVALTVHVHARPRLRRVGFEGADSATIVPGQATLFHAGDLHDPVKAREDAETLREIYAEAGFADATVVPQATPAGEGLVDLRFVVHEGTRATVGPVVFQGAQRTLEPELLAASGLVRGAPLSVEKLTRAPELVSTFYNDRGYLQAHATVKRGDRGADGSTPITFAITEGALFRIGAIRLTKLGLPAAELGTLRKALASRTGGVFLRPVFREDLEAVRAAVARRGAKGTVEPVVTVDPKAKTVDLELELRDGS